MTRKIAASLAALLIFGSVSHVAAWGGDGHKTVGRIAALNNPLSERNALRLLIHLFGDIHQPLHIGCGFIDENGPNGSILIAKDPNVIRIKRLRHNRGGNSVDHR